MRKWYKTKRWERLSAHVRLRDRYECKECGAWGNEVDHIVPRHAGGNFWDEDNLQVLCTDCHRTKSRIEKPHQLAERKKWLIELKNHWG